jgi:hypothetical protein
MDENVSNDLKKYLAEQVIDYIQEQSADKNISAKKFEAISVGVGNILSAIYPNQNKNFELEVPKIVRLVLGGHQLSVIDKIQRVLESFSVSDRLISDVINDIKNLKIASPVISHKDSWVTKIREENSVRSKARI